MSRYLAPTWIPQPLLADHHQQHAAFGHRPIDGLDKIPPRLDVVDVHENPLGAEPVAQTIKEPTGESRAVLAPITDEDRVSGFFHILTPLFFPKYSASRKG